MTPAVHLALILLFFPTLILSDSPFHVPLTHRRPTKSVRNWADEANRLRRRYGYNTTQSRRSYSRAIQGIPILDQVDIDIDIVIVSSTHHKNRVQIQVTLLI